MAHADFQHSVEIAVPRATLHAFLCDLENYVPLHPLIESIRPLAATPTARAPSATASSTVFPSAHSG